MRTRRKERGMGTLIYGYRKEGVIWVHSTFAIKQSSLTGRSTKHFLSVCWGTLSLVDLVQATWRRDRKDQGKHVTDCSE